MSTELGKVEDDNQIENELKKLITMIKSINSEEEKRMVLNKAIRFIENDIKKECKNEVGVYNPKYSRLDVVHCNFTGVGYEWDLPHYAVIWNSKDKLDLVEVIPLTSVDRQEYVNVFSVGTVAGLPKKNTTLLVSDMTRVSRKRLEPITFEHPKKGTKKVRIPNSWTDRIISGILANNTKYLTVENIIINHCGVAMFNKLSTYKELRFRIARDYKFDRGKATLHVDFWNEKSTVEYKLIYSKLPEITSKDTKKLNLLNLYSINEDKRIAAEKFFREFYGL